MTKNKIAWKLKLTSNLVLSGILVAVSGNGVFAQITPDRTLGNESSVVKPNRDIKGIPSNRIDGGARRGGNLFHSFRSFNVEEGRGAYFRNPAGVENILSRVTGGNPSEILGTLGVSGNANLFLINPNGIIFGANASLDINGSFVATTADAIGFGDRGLFSATEPNAPGLLNINPSAFLCDRKQFHRTSRVRFIRTNQCSWFASTRRSEFVAARRRGKHECWRLVCIWWSG
jgi:filamentous hemagglutinin family protein